MSDINLVKIPETPNFVDEGLTPPAQEAGRALSNIFYAVFSVVNYPVEKLRIKQSENLEQYRKNIKSELSKIPEDKLIDPSLSLVGPALDASKFYIEEEKIRKMFSKLIASSMNRDCQKILHPSFVEIIKQLSPLDAIALKSLSRTMSHPIISYRLDETQYSSFGRVGTTVIKNLVIINGIDEQNLDLIPSIVDNLLRLRLADIDYSSTLSDNKLYETTINFFDKTVIPFIEDHYLSEEFFKGRIINKTKGVLELTNFGIDFIKTCII